MPVVLSVAGSDSGGGAGLQADLKTFFACGVHGICAVTSITFQNTAEVRGRFDLPPQAVRAQLEAVLDDLSPAAAKTGMLATAATVREVGRVLREREVPHLVVDPVMISTSGHSLLDEEGVRVMAGWLFPLAEVVTPNRMEAERLSGLALDEPGRFEEAARRILKMGPRAVLLKGGHIEREAVREAKGEATDHLFTSDGSSLKLTAPRVTGLALHGAGCVLSAALAAFLGRGHPLEEAALAAKRFVTEAVRGALRLGGGARPVQPPLLAP